MSALLSVIIAVGNLNQNSEIIAAQSGGANFFDLIKPYLFFGMACSVLLYFYQQKVVSQSYGKMEKYLTQIHQYHIIAFIRPGIFTSLDRTGDKYRTLYVESKAEKNGRSILKNIQLKTIQNTSEGAKVVQFVIAREAEKIKKISKSGRKIHTLRLFDGHAVMQEKNEKEVQVVNFNDSSFDIHLTPPQKPKESKKKKSVMEYSSNELLKKHQVLKEASHSYKAYIPYLTEYHKRIALACSVLFFILLGFPVSIVNQRTGKGFGLGLSLIFIAIYYSFYFSIDQLVMKYVFLPPFIVAWFGNFSMMILATYFFRKRLLLLSQH